MNVQFQEIDAGFVRQHFVESPGLHLLRARGLKRTNMLIGADEFLIERQQRRRAVVIHLVKHMLAAVTDKGAEHHEPRIAFRLEPGLAPVVKRLKADAAPIKARIDQTGVNVPFIGELLGADIDDDDGPPNRVRGRWRSRVILPPPVLVAAGQGVDDKAQIACPLEHAAIMHKPFRIGIPAEERFVHQGDVIAAHHLGGRARVNRERAIGRPRAGPGVVSNYFGIAWIASAQSFGSRKAFRSELARGETR